MGTAAGLGFAAVFDNSADAVGARDFALEFLASVAILATQLSRIGEEIVLWTSSEFAFATLDDAFATGSQHHAAEEEPRRRRAGARAKSARVTGDLVHLLGVVKGLPMAYNRDLQEDKEPVFDAADTVRPLPGGPDRHPPHAELQHRTTGGRRPGRVRRGDRHRRGAGDGRCSLPARPRGGREAGGGSGRRAQCDLSELTPGGPAGRPPEAPPGMLDLLDARRSVASRASHGGTSPDQVAAQLERLGLLIGHQRSWLETVIGG